jgi:hypothetical protein
MTTAFILCGDVAPQANDTLIANGFRKTSHSMLKPAHISPQIKTSIQQHTGLRATGRKNPPFNGCVLCALPSGRTIHPRYDAWRNRREPVPEALGKPG